MKKKEALLVVGLIVGLLFMGLLRYASVHLHPLSPVSGLAAPGYILITVGFTFAFIRSGMPLNQFGFGSGLDLRQIGLVVGALVVLRIFDTALNPVIEDLVGTGRNLERFSDVEGSIGSLVSLLLVNWILAAFGEEFAYRILLMRGIAFAFGDSRRMEIAAVLVQTVVFGLIHAYQGPAGIVGAGLSGLVFGAVTLASRWSIWPAALAHGINNIIGILALYRGG